MRVTHGCIRMFPEDIEALYKTVPPGTRVHIVNQPLKLGWGDAGLYLEAHPPLLALPIATEEEGASTRAQGSVTAPEITTEQEQDATEIWSSATELTRIFVAATEERRVDVSWEAAERVMQAARGVPEPVSTGPVVPVASERPEPFAADNEPTAL
jgi:L,D-transpeptidase ErfK/SrfK